MEVKDAIYDRRSVREFTDNLVDKATVNELLAAAVQAPSAMNMQPWAFVVIQDKALLRAYSNRAKALCVQVFKQDGKLAALKSRLEDPDFNVFYNSGTLIVLFARPVGQHPDWDCCLAAQNLMLAAHGFGLGTCPIGLAWPLFEQDDVKQELCVPQLYTVVLPVIVGYAKHPVETVTRSEPEILCWR